MLPPSPLDLHIFPLPQSARLIRREKSVVTAREPVLSSILSLSLSPSLFFSHCLFFFLFFFLYLSFSFFLFLSLFFFLFLSLSPPLKSLLIFIFYITYEPNYTKGLITRISPFVCSAPKKKKKKAVFKSCGRITFVGVLRGGPLRCLLHRKKSGIP